MYLSHPTWVCGLKQTLRHRLLTSPQSHPTWVCGLKPTIRGKLFFRLIVTPYVGVWIETKDFLPNFWIRGSHPTWVCGLKPCRIYPLYECNQSHPTWVCGLKQRLMKDDGSKNRSHPTWVCGLKQPGLTPLQPPASHTLRGCVD